MTSSLARIVAIVPAGGVGVRAGTAYPKQYYPLLSEPMLRWAVRALLQDPRVDQVRVGVAPDDAYVADALQGLPRTLYRKTGGASRAATVLGTLRDASLMPDDWVLVHDAARPGLPAAALARLIDACLQHDQGGLLAEPVADTVKLGSSGPPRVQRSVPREHLWLAQTPQMFRAGALQAALEAAGDDPSVTDEASAMEHAGHQPLLVPGSVRNMKVTWPDHFELMECLLGGPKYPGKGA